MNKISPIEIQKHLNGLEYPASREEVLEKARENGAAADIMEVLENIADRDYNSPAEVSKEVAVSSASNTSNI